MSHPVLTAWLGPGAHHRGDLVTQGRVRIDGHLEGDLRTDDLVDVGEEGSVDGDVEAPQVLVAGRLNGAVVARERLTLLETAVVTGVVSTPWLDVRNGARLKAEVRTWRDDEG